MGIHARSFQKGHDAKLSESLTDRIRRELKEAADKIVPKGTLIDILKRIKDQTK
jgi:hypothetical protein